MKASVDKIKKFMNDHAIMNIFIIDRVTVLSFNVLDPNVLMCSMRYTRDFRIDQPKFEEHLCEVMGEFFDNKADSNLFVVEAYDNIYIFKDYEVEDLTDYASDLYVVGEYLYDIWAEKFFDEGDSEILIDEIKNGEFNQYYNTVEEYKKNGWKEEWVNFIYWTVY